MSKAVIVVIMINLTIGVAGCSNPFGGAESVVDPNHHPGVADNITVTPSKSMEMVSSSAQAVSTSSGHYKISGSTGSLTNQVQMTTTMRGYRLYSNVQGEIIANGQGL